MCDLTKRFLKEEFEGYKIVAISLFDKKRYSIAMGFCYDDYEYIPVVHVQNCIGYFSKRILDSTSDEYSPFKHSMTGRTAVFKRLGGAENEYYKMMDRLHSFKPNYEIAIYKATIRTNLMEGHYGNYQVIAGRQIIFGERIDMT